MALALRWRPRQASPGPQPLLEQRAARPAPSVGCPRQRAPARWSQGRAQQHRAAPEATAPLLAAAVPALSQAAGRAGALAVPAQASAAARHSDKQAAGRYGTRR